MSVLLGCDNVSLHALKRRELNTQQSRITSCKNLNTSEVKMFDECLCKTAKGCNKIMAKQKCVFKLSIFLSTVNCPLYLVLSLLHDITKYYNATFTQTAETNILLIKWETEGGHFTLMHKVLLYVPEHWRLWSLGWRVTLYSGNMVVWLVETYLGFNTKKKKKASAHDEWNKKQCTTILLLYRVIHKSLRDFRTRLRNNQDRHGRKEHINR